MQRWRELAQLGERRWEAHVPAVVTAEERVDLLHLRPGDPCARNFAECGRDRGIRRRVAERFHLRPPIGGLRAREDFQKQFLETDSRQELPGEFVGDVP
jgi:hypothetical protein